MHACIFAHPAVFHQYQADDVQYCFITQPPPPNTKHMLSLACLPSVSQPVVIPKRNIRNNHIFGSLVVKISFFYHIEVSLNDESISSFKLVHH